MDKPVSRKHVRRKLRKCDNFKRGKCAQCDETTAERVDCDMKPIGRKTVEENE